MIDTYRVLLPKKTFEQANTDKELKVYILGYMQRYPHYVFLREENGFAICRKVSLKKDGGNE